MQKIVASTKGASFLNNILFAGNADNGVETTFFHPNGRELRRRAERKAKRDAKKGIPTPPNGFNLRNLELL